MLVDAADFFAGRADLCSVLLNEVIDGINIPSKTHSHAAHVVKGTVMMIEQISEQ
jgi:hypothetical protein